MSQKATQSFQDFQKQRSQESEEQFVQDLDTLVTAIKNGEAMSSESHLTMLQDVMQVLSKGFSQPSGPLNKVYEFADSFIDALGERQGYVHTCLRHISHAQSGIGYADKMEDKMSSIFNAMGMMGEEIGQFLDIHREGHYTLNSWGQEILERLNDRQLLDAYHLSPDYGVRQINTLKDMVVLEQERFSSSLA